MKRKKKIIIDNVKIHLLKQRKRGYYFLCCIETTTGSINNAIYLPHKQLILNKRSPVDIVRFVLTILQKQDTFVVLLSNYDSKPKQVGKHKLTAAEKQ